MKLFRKPVLGAAAAATALGITGYLFFKESTAPVSPTATSTQGSAAGPATAIPGGRTIVGDDTAEPKPTTSATPESAIQLRPAGPAGPKLTPRTPQPKAPLIQPEGEVLQLSVKFMDGLKARAAQGRLSIVAALVPAGLQAVIDDHAVQFTPVFAAVENRVTSLIARAEAKSGEAQADLHGLLFAAGRDTTPAGVFAMARRFDSMPEVEYVRIEALDRRPQPPEDAAPATADLSGNQQNWRRDGAGIAVDQAWGEYNARGHKMKFGDSEWSVNPFHEDLRTSSTVSRITNLNSAPLPECTVTTINNQPGTPFDTFSDHGSAVFGIVMAGDNGYGMTGSAPEATGVFASEWMPGGRAASIAACLAALDDGDVMLLEMQTNGPYPASEFQPDIGGGNGPADLDQGVWDVVKTGTTAGVVVVTTAGNGNADLDRTAFDSYRARGDNGSIINGAGTSADQFKLAFSSHGSPVHLQGWGQNVSTLGYGNLANVDNYNNANLTDCVVGNQLYTNTFNGTSSAGPIVAGSCVSVQSVAKAELGRPLTSREMRALLVETGKPQLTDSASIGLREAESLTNSSASGDGISNIAGGGAVGTFIRLESNADGDSIQFTIPAVQRGSYKVKVREVIAPDLALYQFSYSEDGTNFVRMGAVVDQYSAGISARVSDIGTASFDNSGTKTFRLTVTGANPAATMRRLTVDSINLEATAAGGKVGPLPNIQRALEKLLGTPVPQSLDASGAYVETFNGWTLPSPEAGWTILHGTGSGGPGRTSLVNSVLRMENPNGPSTNLATLHLNLAGKSGVVLGFDWHEQNDDLNSMPAGAHVGVRQGDGLCLSTDGITWYPILTFDAPNNSWRHVNLPLDALLAARGLTYSNNFRLRFQHTGNDVYANDGFELENVVVYTTTGSPMAISPWHYGTTIAAGQTPAPLNFVILNKGTTPFNFTAAESLPWCSINFTSGTVDPGTAFTITATFSGGIAAGNYGGGIFITRGAETQDLWINLMVMPAPADTARTFVTVPGILTQPPDEATEGPAEIYPLPLNVSGLIGPVTDVNVTLWGLTHSYPNDLDMLLVGPEGQEVMIFSDAGGASQVTNLSFSLDDAAAASVPSPPVGGTSYRPTNNDGGVDPMPGRPARTAAYPSLLSAFNGTNANGVWRLYIMDDAGEDMGAISGYQLDITTAGAAGLGLAEEFTGGVDLPDLSGIMLTFSPFSSPSGYTNNFTSAPALPTTHTAAAKTLTLPNDGSDLVVASRPFTFYGRSYTTFFVNSNGNVTFTVPDTTTGGMANMHALPRVAAFYRDLDPSAGGTVQSEEFADRLVITFTAIRQFGAASVNTFQYEFFLDTGVIRLSYGSMQSTSGITGLSRGMGSTGFVETNLVPNLTPTRAPWGGTPAAIPGRIEAENYDTGVPVAWNDNDATNNGGQYRPTEAVDLEVTTDAGGGFNVGWTNPGEWIEYTVNVLSAGNYTMLGRFASGVAGGSFRVEFGGVDKTGPVAITGTGGWQNWGTTVTSRLNLAAGVQIMRVHLITDGLNLNHLTFFREEAGTEPGLVARWKFDESNGTTASDSAGGHHGTVNTAPVWQPAGGIIGGAISLPGNGRWITAPTDDLVKLRPLSGRYSVSAWVKLNDNSQQMIFYHGLGCSSWSSWYMGVGGSENLTAAGRFTCGFRTANASASTEIASAAPAITGQWTHLASTYDGAMLRFYVNGQPAGSTAAANTLPYNSPEPSLLIGGDAGCGGRTVVNGMLDDLRLYAAALTPAEVLAQAYAPLAPAGDIDNDGQANGTEISWGLDPFNPGASLTALMGRNGLDQPTLTWPGLTGKTYRVEYSTNMTAWAVISTVTPGASASQVFTETNPARIFAPRSYYRLVP